LSINRSKYIISYSSLTGACYDFTRTFFIAMSPVTPLTANDYLPHCLVKARVRGILH